MLLVLLVLLAAAAGLVRWRRRRRPAEPVDDLEGLLDEDERSSLDEALASVLAEHGASLQRLLEAHLDVLTRRGVPIRAVRPTDDPPVVRVCFANGTVVRVRPARPGDWAPIVLALADSGRGVVVESWKAAEDGGVTLVLAVPGGPRRRATAIGLDQAD